METSALNEIFALPGILTFEEVNGLVRANISTPAANATVYLQGAHLTHWQPAGEEPVLFLSGKSELAAAKAIRGGVPLIFPWFGPRRDGGSGPSHGFARTRNWDLAFAALAGDDLHLTFTLAANEASRVLGFDHFRLAFELAIGRTLRMKLTVANEGTAPLAFEEALHTYFGVGDVRQTRISGLDGVAFLDKVDGGRMKPGVEGELVLKGSTDRVYFNTTATVVVDDPKAGRRITVEKSGSNSTVVWNPWQEGSAKLADMEPAGWEAMVCVETANAGENAITLAPNKSHTMSATVRVDRG